MGDGRPLSEMDERLMTSPNEGAMLRRSSFPSASSGSGKPLSSRKAPETLAAKHAKESIDASSGSSTVASPRVGIHGSSWPS